MNRLPVLKRFDIRVLKDRGSSANPTIQVPAAGVQIDFYREGATLAVDANLVAGDPTEVTVYNRGCIMPGDTLQLGAASSPVVVVGTHPDDRGTLLLTYSGMGVLALEEQTRLIPTNDRPLVHMDPIGATTTGDSYITTDGTGRAGCYISAYRFDYIITVGSENRIYPDAVGSFVMR